MRKEKVISNDIGVYLNQLSDASSALAAIMETCDHPVSERQLAGIHFLAEEINDQLLSLEDFYQNDNLKSVKSEFDIYQILAERKKQRNIP